MYRILIRWSWRDLRARWMQVVAIALIIAIGTGSFAAFNSMTQWRERSLDASFELVKVHDLRASLGAGAFLPTGALRDAASAIDQADQIAELEERLILPTQVDVSSSEEPVLVRGRLIGVEVSGDGQGVDSLFVEEGRPFEAGDNGAEVAILEYNFARHYDLPPEGNLRLAGNRRLSYVGQATHPEYFSVVTEEGSLLAEADFAAVFTPLDTAGNLTGHPGEVNDLVLRLVEGADRDLVQAELARELEPLGAEVITIDDNDSYSYLIRDVEGDQQTTTIISVALLAGAVFAAFNLTTRMIEAQRREIGIGMALGAPRWLIGLRPMLVGAQIAVLGVVLGAAVGVGLGIPLRSLLTQVLPLPITETPFQLSVFAQAAAIGIIAPLAAILFPVWQAVRVAPVQAIRVGHLAARGSGLSPLLRRLPLPGGGLGQMPVRNLVRSPRRALLTILGIGAVVAALIGVLGALDAYIAAGDRGEAALAGDQPDRLVIELSELVDTESAAYDAVASDAPISRAEPVTRVPATLVGDSEEINVFLDFVDFESTLWRPTQDGAAPDASMPGILLARKVGEDLGIGTGDSVVVRHPLREAAGYRVVETELPVLGFHEHPFRPYAYIDRSYLDLAGLAGLANQISALPAPELREIEVKRALFDLPEVASVQTVAAVAGAISDRIEDFTAIFYVLEGAAILLAGLIAFNSAAINVDERRREHATMFAFGLPVNAVLRMAVVENALLGIAATFVGLLGGFLFVQWLVEVTIAQTAPDIGLEASLSLQTILLGAIVGTLVVAIAPLFSLRRLLRMDIPSTLRVME